MDQQNVIWIPTWPAKQAGNIIIQQYSDKSIKVTMTSTTAFDTNSYSIKSGFIRR